jgi:hypothetical protein
MNLISQNLVGHANIITQLYDPDVGEAIRREHLTRQAARLNAQLRS